MAPDPDNYGIPWPDPAHVVLSSVRSPEADRVSGDLNRPCRR